MRASKPLTQDEAYIIGRICKTLGYEIESISKPNGQVSSVRILGKFSPNKYMDDIQNGYNRFYKGQLQMSMVKKHTFGSYSAYISKLTY